MAAHRKNYDVAVEMYESGSSIQDVADRFGITRQAMWKILTRRGVSLREKLRYGQENHFFRHGEGYSSLKKRAVLKVTKAIKSGKLIPKPCEECGFDGKCKDGRRKVHAHHANYSEPLEVKWLCKKCHDLEHENE